MELILTDERQGESTVVFLDTYHKIIALKDTTPEAFIAGLNTGFEEILTAFEHDAHSLLSP